MAKTISIFLIYRDIYDSNITSVIALFSSSYFTAWESVNFIDEFTDEQINYSVFENADHSIQVSREIKGDVRMFIIRKKLGHFEPNGLIQLRVDSNDVLEVDPESSRRMAKYYGKPIFQWEPQTVGFLI